jgi:dipeptidase E
MKRRDFLISSGIGAAGMLAARATAHAAPLVASQANTRKILIAGGGFGTPFLRYMAQLTGKPRPKMLYLPTASADAPAGVLGFYRACSTLNVEPQDQISFIASTSQSRT